MFDGESDDPEVVVEFLLEDREVADKMLVAGYHFPFTAAGHIVKTGSGYDLVPVMWQPL